MTIAADRIRCVAEGIGSGKVTIGGIVDTLGASGTGLCLLMLGGATLVPGIAPLFGAAICTVSLGMALGHGKPYLPGLIRRRTLDGMRLRTGLKRLLPAVDWIGRWLEPRSKSLLDRVGTRLLGVAGVINGILIVLPIPFGNTAPALAVIVMALGLIAGDGLAVGFGFVLTAIALAIDAALIGLGYAAISGLASSIV